LGEFETAFRLLSERTCPSWLYPVTMGATTVWERWDSLLPDGSVNPGEMTSFNHYALGSVADWMQRTIGGLTPAEAGYRLIQIRPYPGRGLTHAQVRHITPYGLVESSWRIENGKFYIEATIPPNTRAFVTLPNGKQSQIGSGVWNWQVGYSESLINSLGEYPKGWALIDG
jgi:alpha-L-rhamnosidase